MRSSFYFPAAGSFYSWGMGYPHFAKRLVSCQPLFLLLFRCSFFQHLLRGFIYSSLQGLAGFFFGGFLCEPPSYGHQGVSNNPRTFVFVSIGSLRRVVISRPLARMVHSSLYLGANYFSFSSSMMMLKATSWSFRSIMLLRPSVIFMFMELILFLFTGCHRRRRGSFEKG